MKVREDTEELFVQDKEYVMEYLKARGVDGLGFEKIYESMNFGLLEDSKFMVGTEPYEISHFLSKSDISGYDIRKLNVLMNLEETESVAFALVLGDDVLCYDKDTAEVYLWLVQTDEGRKITAFKSVEEFLNKLSNEEENQ